MKSFIKQFIIYILSFIPFKNTNSIFTSLFSKQHSGGPGRFLYNLNAGLSKQNIDLNRFFLSGCKSALILSNSPGDFFLKLCHKKNILTVLRVDGFYPPNIFNDKKNTADDARQLTKYRQNINLRMKQDIELCKYVIYQSQFSKNMADKYLYQRSNNYSIIYNGVNTKHFKPVNQSHENIQLLMLGTWRDVDLMISSLNVFQLTNNKQNVTLKIIGPMTKKVSAVFTRWLELNHILRKKINRKDNVAYADLPSEIAECDISLHLKSGDWCPNAVLETLSCGIPVICQNHGGTKELVETAGIIVDSEPFIYDKEFEQRCAKETLQVLADLNNYKLRARELIIKKFSLEQMIQQYKQILIDAT